MHELSYIFSLHISFPFTPRFVIYVFALAFCEHTYVNTHGFPRDLQQVRLVFHFRKVFAFRLFVFNLLGQIHKLGVRDVSGRINTCV